MVKAKSDITPRGTVQYPAIFKPKAFKGETKREYSILLVLKQEEKSTQDLIDKVDSFIYDVLEENKARINTAIVDKEKKDKAYKSLAPEFKAPSTFITKPYSTHEDDPEKVPSGTVVFKFSTQAEFTDKTTGVTKEKTLLVVDAKNNPIKDSSLNMGNDSVVRIQFKPYCTEFKANGLELYAKLGLEVVQVIKFVEWTPGETTNLFGVVDDEDGFEFDGESVTAVGSTAQEEGVDEEDPFAQ